MVRMKELIQALSVSRQTVYNWMKLGLPVYKIGETIFFDLEEVTSWIKSHKRSC